MSAHCYQYAASHIVSLACYEKYRQVGKDFIPGYLDLLAAGSSINQVEALRQYVDVNLEDTATIRGALDYIERLLDELEANTLITNSKNPNSETRFFQFKKPGFLDIDAIAANFSSGFWLFPMPFLACAERTSRRPQPSNLTLPKVRAPLLPARLGTRPEY